MKIRELLELKKYIKNIDKKIKIRFGKSFECNTDKKIVWLPLKDNREDAEMFKKWYEKYFNEKLTEKDLIYISALHEVGHIMTWTEELEEERVQQYSLMQVAHQYKLMSTEDLNKNYFEIPMELIATEWGRNYYRNLM